jgi:hypothetical protein
MFADSVAESPPISSVISRSNSVGLVVVFCLVLFAPISASVVSSSSVRLLVVVESF